MKEERNALQKEVFPKLRELCMEHGFRFQAIDLRWGVSEEAGLDQQTMKICLEEIERSQKVSPKPNFIVLLGDRYGWRPLPYEIPADEFEEIKSVIKDAYDRKFLFWEGDVLTDDLLKKREGWYCRDKNAVPPVYCLKPRFVDYDEDASDEEIKEARKAEYKDWEDVEKRLKSILLNAIDELGWDKDDSRRFKYESSATEQEIIKGVLNLPEDGSLSKEHVFSFIRTIKGKNLISFNDYSKDFFDFNASGTIDASAEEKIIALKAKIEKKLSKSNRFDYETEWEEKGVSRKHIKKLCEDVYYSLEKVINEQIDEFEDKDPLDIEIEAHKEFGEERCKFFIGREDNRAQIKNYLETPNSKPLIVYGESGSGKSALMAQAVEDLYHEVPVDNVIVRFIGATPESSDMRSLLGSLSRQITRIYGEDNSNIPSEYNDLVQDFKERLNFATAEKTLFIFLDALDQLSDSDSAHNLTWLPDELPENVHIVISTLKHIFESSLNRRIPSENVNEVKKLEKEDGKSILKEWIKHSKRKITDEQRNEIISKFEVEGLPLYLKLAFEESKLWKSYTPAPELEPDIKWMINNLFERLSRPENHGEMLVSRSLGYLSAAKNGLSEDEIIDILSMDREIFYDFIYRARSEPTEILNEIKELLEENEEDLKEDTWKIFERLQNDKGFCFNVFDRMSESQISFKIPVAIWSRLYFDLDSYLTERSADKTTLLAFYHRQLGEVARAKYFNNTIKKSRHQLIAEYFHKQDLFFEKDDERVYNVRKVSELPFQETYGELWNELEITLTDLNFIETKVSSKLINDLLEDYGRIGAGHAYPGTPLSPISKNQSVEEFADFVYSQAYILKKCPSLTFQQAYNMPDDLTPHKKAEKVYKNLKAPELWLKWLNKPSYLDPCLNTLIGHDDEVTCCEYSNDGMRIVSGSSDKTVKIWDSISNTELFTFDGHEGRVNACSFSKDGKLIVSASDDKKVKIWDWNKRTEIITFNDHNGAVKDASFSNDCKKVVSASEDCTVKIWNAETGEILTSYDKHTGPVNSCKFSGDGSLIVSASDDNSVIIWDVNGNKCIASLNGHEKPVYSCSFSPMDDKIISASEDRTVKIWDVESKSEFLTLKGHSSSVFSCQYSTDGEYIVSGSADNTIKVWDKYGKELATFKGHSDDVKDCSYSYSGNQIISASADGTIKVWMAGSPKNFEEQIWHEDKINSCSFTPDSKHIISGSEDGTIKLWDETAEENIATFIAPNPIKTISVSPSSLEGRILNSDLVSSELLDLYYSSGNLSSGKTIYIIINSTFADMKNELNTLKKYVFPRLNELCRAHGFRLEYIDFNWGITEKAGYEQKTMDIIFDLIEKFSNEGLLFFINLLGNRYGWRPLPSEIPELEFHEIISHLSNLEKDLLLWDENLPEENYLNSKIGWYRKDENTIPPVYRLKPRIMEYNENDSNELIAEAKNKEYAEWSQVEDRIRSTILNSLNYLGFDEMEPRFLKYVASATELQIVKSLDFMKEGFTINVFRDIVNIYDMDFSGYGQNFIDLDYKGKIDQIAAERLVNLKDKLSELLPASIQYKYLCTLNGKDISYNHLNQLSDDIYDFLSKTIINEIYNFELLEPSSVEIERHQDKYKELSKFFIGRSDVIQEVINYMKSNNYHPFIIHGVSGSGKTSLMAKLIDLFDKESLSLIYRFIGTTTSSSNLISLLTGICIQICSEYGKNIDDMDLSNYDALRKTFLRCISFAREDKPLVIFIDSINFLKESNDLYLEWIPMNLPNHVHIVLSLLSDEIKNLEDIIPAQNIVELEALNVNEMEKILRLWLDDSKRSLQPDQMEEILKKSAINGNPLFLKLAFEEACNYESYTPFTQLESDIPGLVLRMLKRLSDESNHGKNMVSHSLGYISASKNGISEDEMLLIMPLDDTFWEDIPYYNRPLDLNSRLPFIMWKKLFFDLKPYLIEKELDSEILLNFSNQLIKEIITYEFLNEDNKILRHQILANYFNNQNNIRKLSELPYHQINAGLINELENTLSNITFLEAKCWMGFSNELFEDYKRAGIGYFHKNPPIKTPFFYNGKYGVFCPYCITWDEIKEEDIGQLIKCPSCYSEIKLNKFTISSEWSIAPPIHKINNIEKFNINSPLLDDFSDFVKDNIDNITNSPELFVPLAANQPKKSHVSKSAQYLMETQFNKPWIRQTNIPEYKSSCVATLDEHSDELISCVYSPDGEHILTSSKDNEIKIWDSRECIEITSFSNQANASKYSPDGQRIISASNDGLITVWDAITKNKIAELNDSSRSVNYCSFSPDGKFIVSVSDDKTIKIWDGKIYQLINTFKCNDQIFSFSFSPDSKNIAYVTGSNEIKIMELESGKEIRKIDTLIEKNNACSYSPDGLQIVSGSHDGSISIWDLRTGQKMNTLKGHDSNVNSCIYSPDGNTIVSVSDDKTLKVWDAITLKELSTHFGHSDSITTCDFSPDGHYVITGSTDSTIKIWDIVNKNKKSYKPEHNGSINDCSYSMDGNELITASNDCELKLWDSKNISEMSSASEENPILSCSYSPFMDSIVSGDNMGKLLKWKSDELSILNQFNEHKCSINDCSFSPVGTRIISCSDDRTIKIYESNTNQMISSIKGHQNGINSCIFSQDNQYIISGASDNSLKILDADSFNEIGSFITKGKILSVSNSQDGTKIVVGDSNNLLYVLEIESNHPKFYDDLDFDNDSNEQNSSIDIVAGDLKGNMYKLNLLNYKMGLVIVTAWKSPIDNSVAYKCPFCNEWSRIMESDKGQETSCKYCDGRIKLNKFVIESDWKVLDKSTVKEINLDSPEKIDSLEEEKSQENEDIDQIETVNTDEITKNIINKPITEIKDVKSNLTESKDLKIKEKSKKWWKFWK